MIKVLIADDHPVMRKGLRLMLTTEADINVVAEAGNGAEVLNEVVKHEPDIVLMDIGMPVMNGISALRALNEQKRSCKVIILSTYHDDVYTREAINAGAWGYILKGESGDEVIEAVRSVSQGKRYFSGVITEHMRDLMVSPQKENPFEQLSTRERQVLQQMLEGKTSNDIGQMLHLSPKTVDTYRGRVMLKLNVSDMPALVKLALRHHFIANDDRAPESI